MDIEFPDRIPTSRWHRAALHSRGLLDGACLFVGGLLALDALLGGAVLGILVRLPGGRPLPWPIGLAFAAALIFRARLRWILAIPALLALANAVEFWVLVAHGDIRTGLPVPFSIASLALFGLALLPPAEPGRLRWAGAVAIGPALLLLHLFTFGATDYRRPADAIVVFGAKPGSLALEDRTREGVRLWHEGRAPLLVLSGAPGEVEDMARLARLGGVPESALVRDSEGLNTAATLRNLRVRRVLAVSHDYHLARIKLHARRLGLECATVPCAESRPLTRKSWFVARETAAFAAYYLFRRD